MKTLVAIGLSLGMVILSLGTPVSAGTSLSARAAAQPVAISLFAAVDPSYQDVGPTNWFTRYVEKTFNVKLNWTTVAPSDAGTKQQLLLESGNYPAVFYNATFTPAQLLKFGKQGILVPLNTYLKKYAPNVLKAFGEFPGAKEAATAPDGTIYGVPSLNFCLHCYYSAKFWINTRWLARLHLSVPRTTAQFARVLQAFKRMPGVRNPIPLSGATDGWHSDPTVFLMNAFIYTDGDIGGSSPGLHVFYRNGKLAFAPIQPQWQQGLKYIRSLVTSGVLDASAFTQNSTQLRAEAAQGRVGVFAFGVDNGVINYGFSGPQSNKPKSSDWVVVPPLVGPSGVNDAAFFGQGPTTVPFAITNKATPAQIKAILTVVNWIYTLQGTTMMDFGPQGKNWAWAKPGQRGLCSKQAIIDINWNAPTKNWGWNQLGPMYQSKAWRCGGPYTPIFSPTSEEEKYQAMTAEYYEGHQPKQVYPAVAWLPTSQTTINSYVAQNTYDFILGRKDIVSGWNSYISGLQGLGLAQYLQTLQSANPKPMLTTDFCPSAPMTLPCHH